MLVSGGDVGAVSPAFSQVMVKSGGPMVMSGGGTEVVVVVVGAGVGFGVGVGVGVGVAVAFDVVVVFLLGVGLGFRLVDVGFALRWFRPQLTLYLGGDEVVGEGFGGGGGGLGVMLVLMVVGFGGHGPHGGYPGFLVEEALLDDDGLLVGEDTGVEVMGSKDDVGIAMLELDQTGGGRVREGYSEVGFGVGVGVGVDEAPGPSPSQLILYDGFPILN